MSEAAPIIVAFLLFCSVAATIIVVGRHLVTQASMQRRLPARAGVSPAERSSPAASAGWKIIDETKFGVDSALRAKIRKDLIRAGYFSDQAVHQYVIWRFALVLILPILAFIATSVFMPESGRFMQFGFVAVAALVGIGGPDAYVSRRQRLLVGQYRLVFPDLLDMLVVCVDAGLVLDAAFDRISDEISKQCREMGVNLQIMGAEMRAGRSNLDALQGLTERLNLDEARVFVAMLRQSIELGADIGEALRIYSDEMRTKRLLRAEETANKLPVKLVLPLGACIFPVILLVIMVPVVIRLLAIMQ
jgi:tight adherence protein C